MRLPMPNATEVEEFIHLYKEHFGVTLSSDEALDGATRTVQLFCLLNDAIYPLRTQE